MPLFTPQNAREMSARGHEKRKQNKLAKLYPGTLGPVVPVISAEAIAVELARLSVLKERLYEALLKATGFKAYDGLTRAYDRIFRAWTYVAQIPGPGQYHPEKPPTYHGLSSLNLESTIGSSPLDNGQVLDIEPVTPKQESNGCQSSDNGASEPG
jgi:hypothetical protein